MAEARSATSSSTSTRTRTTRSTGCCSSSPSSTETCSRSATRTSSIYAFRGADIRNVLEFERDFPGAKTIALEQNYRSTQNILDAANGVIRNNRERKEKNLWSELGEGDPVRVVEVEDEHAEARYVAAEIAMLVEQGYSGSEIAVFYRTNAQSRVLEDVLVRQGVAYQVIGGPRFYERAEVKDLIAYLQVLDNPYDAVSLLRAANRPRRGIGDSTLARLMTWADQREISLWEATAEAEQAGVGTAPQKAVRAFRTTIESLMSAAQELDVPELIEAVLDRSGYREALEAERTIEAQGRLENLQELVSVAQEWREQTAEPSLSSFLQEVSLYSDQDAIRGEGSLVTLMTLHNAKGLEFRAVYLIGMEEGIFPHSRSIEEQGVEEERRLCYVGMTRAMERLTLLHASSRMLYGGRSHNLPSRFLDEVPDRHVERERLRPASWSGYGAPGPEPARAARGRALARHRRLGATRHARRGRRRPHRGRRRGHGPFRGGRLRAPADARLRSAREALERFATSRSYFSVERCSGCPDGGWPRLGEHASHTRARLHRRSRRTCPAVSRVTRKGVIVQKFRFSMLIALVALVSGALAGSALSAAPHKKKPRKSIAKVIAFSGVYSGQASTKVDGTTAAIAANGAGKGTLIGTSKITGSGSADTSQQPCPPFGGTGTIKGAGGTILFKVVPGAKGCGDEGGHVFSLSGYMLVTKATGKLVKAKGTLKFSGVYDRDDGSFQIKLTGTLKK